MTEKSATQDGMPSGPARMFRVSNLVTYSAIACGLAAVLAAYVTHDASAAGALMAMSVIADTFDGRFARRFPHTEFQSAFGVQIDSLADAINSGFVPVAVLGALVVRDLSVASALWCFVALVYVLCAVTRLGFYNLTHGQGQWFVGLPTPASTLFVSTALIWRPGLLVSGIVLAACAAAMVGSFRMPRPSLRGLLLFAAWATLLTVVHGTAVLRGFSR